MEMIGHIYTILALILGTIQIFSGYEYNSPLTFSWSCLLILRASLVAQLVKNPPTMQETLLWSLDWEDPLEKGKATHSNILAWRIPRATVHGVAKSQTQLSDFHMCVPVDLGFK